MDLNSFRERYNKDFHLNTENKSCLCGSRNNKKLFDFDRYLLKNRIVTCKDCGLIFSNPILKKSYLKDFYESDFYRQLYTHELKDNKKDIFFKEGDNSTNAIEFLKKYILNKQNINILEIGSGHNSNLLHFKNLGNLYATDYSNASKHLANQLGIKFEQGGVEVLKKFNIKFDVIILSHVIEHFHDFKNDILEIKKYTKENSIYYIEVPSMDLKYNLDQLQNAHNFYFTKNTFISHLEKLGLNCIEHDIASDIHQYGVFENRIIDKNLEVVNDYQRVIKMHRKFCYDFYWKYLVNLYLRGFIKKILPKKMTIFIQNTLAKIRK